MTKRVLLLASHAVAEYDDLRMFTDLGFDCFAPGGYEVPGTEGEGIRPPLPDAPHHPDLVVRLQEVRAERGEPGPAIDWGKAALHDDIIDWADVIIVHHFPEQWIAGQWDRIKHKRVIWRTCGQSNRNLEEFMGQFVGLEIVRYSPAERRYFGDTFAGQSALIRFGKYPDDYGPWTGEWPGVINITQHMAQRGDACGYGFWQEATRGLARPIGADDGPPPPFALPLGPGSDAIGGPGSLSYSEMLDWLRWARVYLYTGTRPASYTLGLIEAMLSGVPIISIGARAWGDSWGGEDLFEAASAWHGIGKTAPSILPFDATFEDPAKARNAICTLLDYPDKAATISKGQRARAIELFDVATVGAQWREFLS
jgi:hypothetical protein